MERLVQVYEPIEVQIEFALNCKCRTTVQLRSLSQTTPVAFKIQTSSPDKFLVNPPSGLIPPLSSATFQVILKPQPHLPPSYPRSPSDRFLIKTALFDPNSSVPTHPNSINSWFASRPNGFSTVDLKLKVAFVGPLLLQDAVSRGDLDAVRNLIRRRRPALADLPPAESDSLLRVATELAEPEDMVHLLLEAGLRIHGPVSFDTFIGCYEKDVVVREIGEAMLDASRRGDVRELKKLLRIDAASVNYRDPYGLTALHYAACKGHKDVVLMLIEAGLDLECEDAAGHVPLHMAVEGGDLETVQILVDKGVNLNARSSGVATPLFMARSWGHDDIYQFLMSRGAL